MTAIIHGVDGAIKRLGNGLELAGIAKDAELEARGEYDKNGAVELILKDASRHQAAADLCWLAVQKAAQDGDYDQVDKFLARFGWLNAGAARLWLEVAKMTKGKDKKNIIDLLKKGGEDGKD